MCKRLESGEREKRPKWDEQHCTQLRNLPMVMGNGPASDVRRDCAGRKPALIVLSIASDDEIEPSSSVSNSYSSSRATARRDIWT